MNKNKSYTIKEISESLGVTKSAINQKINQKMTNKLRSKFVSKKKVNGRVTVLVNEEGYQWLKKNVRKKSKDDSQSNEDVITVLKEQLKQKDDQIEKLQILLNQSQQLQLKQNEKIEMLENNSKLHWWQKLFK